jgi:hypothetical protein
MRHHVLQQSEINGPVQLIVSAVAADTDADLL